MKHKLALLLINNSEYNAIYLEMEPFGAGDWSRKSELEPHFFEPPLIAKFDMEFERGRGCPADGVTAFGVICALPGV